MASQLLAGQASHINSGSGSATFEPRLFTIEQGRKSGDEMTSARKEKAASSGGLFDFPSESRADYFGQQRLPPIMPLGQPESGAGAIM